MLNWRVKVMCMEFICKGMCMYRHVHKVIYTWLEACYLLGY